MNNLYKEIQAMSDQRVDMIQTTSEQLTLKLEAVEDALREKLGLEGTDKNGDGALLNMSDHETGNVLPLNKTIYIDSEMYLETNAKFVLRLANSSVQVTLNVKCNVSGDRLIMTSVGTKEEDYYSFDDFVLCAPLLVVEAIKNAVK